MCNSSNTPVGRADAISRADSDIPPKRFPEPEDQDEMTDAEIGEWYESRLPEKELEKFRRVATVLERRELTGSTRHRRILMNAFHEDPTEPVDVNGLLKTLGVR